MSTPNPFALDQAHWDLIMAFIGLKAGEDDLTDTAEMIGLMQQYWLLLNDLPLLTAEVAAIELEQAEAALVETKQAVIDQEREIADRKAGRPPPRTTVAVEIAPEPEPPPDQPPPEE